MLGTLGLFLSSWCLLTLSGQVSPGLGQEEGSKVKVTVKEGHDVVLPCSISTKEDITSKFFLWMKDGQKNVFLYVDGRHYNNSIPGQDEQFKGRVLHFEDELKSGNASILIRNTTVADSGDYTCYLSPESQIFHVELVVGSKVKVIVKEGHDVVLNCSSSTDIQSKLFDWMKDGQKNVFLYVDGRHYNNSLQDQDEQFKGRVSHFKDELKSGNASILIRNTTVADSGNYTCGFPHLPPESRIFHVELLVGASPKPSITSLNKTKDSALLQCAVHGASPEPAVEWQDSAGNIFPAEEPHVSQSGGRYNIILQTTVNKTDHYHCVVTQKEINHQTRAQTFVYISEKPCEDSSSFQVVWGLVAFILVSSLLAAVLTLLVVAKFITIRWDQGSPEQRNGVAEHQSTASYDVCETPEPLRGSAALLIDWRDLARDYT